jgi:hypothetical protein
VNRAAAALALLAARTAVATPPCPPAGPTEPRIFPSSGSAAARNAFVRVQQGWSKPVVLDNLRLFNNGVPVDVTIEEKGFAGDQWRVLRPSAPLAPGSAEVRALPQTLATFDVIAADDTTPPTFGGITGVDALGAEGCTPARLRFRFGEMSDDITAPERLVVHLYISTQPARQDFGKPVMVPASAAEIHPQNALIVKNQTLFVVAGLVDEAGNESARSDEWRVEFTGSGCQCGGAPAAALPVFLFGLFLAATPSRGTSRDSSSGR